MFTLPRIIIIRRISKYFQQNLLTSKMTNQQVVVYVWIFQKQIRQILSIYYILIILVFIFCFFFFLEICSINVGLDKIDRRYSTAQVSTLNRWTYIKLGLYFSPLASFYWRKEEQQSRSIFSALYGNLKSRLPIMKGPFTLLVIFLLSFVLAPKTHQRKKVSFAPDPEPNKNTQNPVALPDPNASASASTSTPDIFANAGRKYGTEIWRIDETAVSTDIARFRDYKFLNETMKRLTFFSG